MNNSIAETLHCVNPSSPITTKMSVLERQRQRQPLKWQQEQLIQQQPISNLNGNEQLGAFLFGNNDQGFVELLSGRTMKPDLGMETGWGDDDLGKLLNYGNGSDFEATYAIPRTASCPPSVAASMAEVAASKGLALSPATGKENPKKRKADKSPNIKAGEGKDQEKKMKECAEEEGSKISQEYSNSNSKSTTTTNGSKKTDKSNVSDFPKQDYIHVRARRGQATDSHSLAERVRREKISERMKYLQDLVPGCNKITGKAGMLDEIINYVQSLQKQVEFLSMKLAAVNPRQDCEADNYFVKEQMFPACTSGVVNAAQVHFNALAQDIGVIPQDATLRRAISAPVHIPDAVLESACFNQVQHLNWDAEIQNLLSIEYQQGRPPSFVSQPFAGYMETGHVKMEM